MHNHAISGLAALIELFVRWVEGKPWSDAKKAAMLGLGAGLGVAAAAYISRSGETGTE